VLVVTIPWIRLPVSPEVTDDLVESVTDLVSAIKVASIALALV
jgi:hypothetical protein